MDSERLVNEHLGIVYRLARRYARRLPDTADVGELESAGTLGLIEAANRFDPSRGATFKTFAEWRVRGAILDAMRVGSRFTLREYRQRADGAGPRLILLEGKDCSGGVPADAAGDGVLRRRIRAAIALLPRRDARVVVWRYWRGIPQAAVAARLGVNPSRVSQLEARALRHLRQILKDLA